MNPCQKWQFCSTRDHKATNSLSNIPSIFPRSEYSCKSFDKQGPTSNQTVGLTPFRCSRISSRARSPSRSFRQTILANGGADEIVSRAEEVLLVAVDALETHGGQAKEFADKLLRNNSGSTAPIRSKNAIARTLEAIEKKLLAMVNVNEDGNISVSRHGKVHTTSECMGINVAEIGL